MREHRPPRTVSPSKQGNVKLSSIQLCRTWISVAKTKGKLWVGVDHKVPEKGNNEGFVLALNSPRLKPQYCYTSYAAFSKLFQNISFLTCKRGGHIHLHKHPLRQTKMLCHITFKMHMFHMWTFLRSGFTLVDIRLALHPVLYHSDVSCIERSMAADLYKATRKTLFPSRPFSPKENIS